MRTRPRRPLVLGVALAASWLAAAPAGAHVEPTVTEAPAGSRAELGFTIEHGCAGSPTVAVAMRMPAEVEGVQPVGLPGWTLTTEPRADAEIDVVEWSGGPLPDAEALTFTVSVGLPVTPGATLLFPTVQTCEVGELAWISTGGGETEADNPAPRIVLTDVDPTRTTSTTAATSTTAVAPSTSAPLGDDLVDGPDLPLLRHRRRPAGTCERRRRRTALAGPRRGGAARRGIGGGRPQSQPARLKRRYSMRQTAATTADHERVAEAPSRARACARSSCRRWRRRRWARRRWRRQAEILRMSSFWRTRHLGEVGVEDVGEQVAEVLDLGRRPAAGGPARRGSSPSSVGAAAAAPCPVWSRPSASTSGLVWRWKSSTSRLSLKMRRLGSTRCGALGVEHVDLDLAHVVVEAVDHRLVVVDDPVHRRRGAPPSGPSRSRSGSLLEVLAHVGQRRAPGRGGPTRRSCARRTAGSRRTRRSRRRRRSAPS